MRHRAQLWGYPISLEVIGLIYNETLVDGAPPSQLSELISFHQKLKAQHLELVILGLEKQGIGVLESYLPLTDGALAVWVTSKELERTGTPRTPTTP
jgi:hypothetical protein